jgi:hypothetical protein
MDPLPLIPHKVDYAVDVKAYLSDWLALHGDAERALCKFSLLTMSKHDKRAEPVNLRTSYRQTGFCERHDAER